MKLHLLSGISDSRGKHVSTISLAVMIHLKLGFPILNHSIGDSVILRSLFIDNDKSSVSCKKDLCCQEYF